MKIGVCIFSRFDIEMDIKAFLLNNLISAYHQTRFEAMAKPHLFEHIQQD